MQQSGMANILPGSRRHLGESSVVVSQHGRVGTVQLADDPEALVELRENVHHRAGEQRVLRCRLELGSRKNQQRGGGRGYFKRIWQPGESRL